MTTTTPTNRAVNGRSAGIDAGASSVSKPVAASRPKAKPTPELVGAALSAQQKGVVEGPVATARAAATKSTLEAGALPNQLERVQENWGIFVYGGSQIVVENAESEARVEIEVKSSSDVCIKSQGVAPDDQIGFVLEAFDRCSTQNSRGQLARAGSMDGELAPVYNALFGLDGALRRNELTLEGNQASFSNGKLLCFDFNGTLQGRSGFRPGLAPTLADFRGKNARCVITTRGSAFGAERSVHSAGGEIEGAYDSQSIGGAACKLYRKVLEDNGLSLEEAKARFLVVGDNGSDAPGDIDGAVFVQNSAETPMEALLVLTEELDRLGKGDFSKGFDELEKIGGKVGPLAVTIDRPKLSDEVTVRRVSNVTIGDSAKVHCAALESGGGSATARLALRYLEGLTDYSDRALALDALAKSGQPVGRSLAESWKRNLADSERALTQEAKTLARPAGSMDELRAQARVVETVRDTAIGSVLQNAIAALESVDNAALLSAAESDLAARVEPIGSLITKALEASPEPKRAMGFFEFAMTIPMMMVAATTSMFMPSWGKKSLDTYADAPLRNDRHEQNRVRIALEQCIESPSAEQRKDLKKMARAFARQVSEQREALQSLAASQTQMRGAALERLKTVEAKDTVLRAKIEGFLAHAV